jgi:hypothetical protein
MQWAASGDLPLVLRPEHLEVLAEAVCRPRRRQVNTFGMVARSKAQLESGNPPMIGPPAEMTRFSALPITAWRLQLNDPVIRYTPIRQAKVSAATPPPSVVPFSSVRLSMMQNCVAAAPRPLVSLHHRLCIKHN